MGWIIEGIDRIKESPTFLPVAVMGMILGSAVYGVYYFGKNTVERQQEQIEKAAQTIVPLAQQREIAALQEYFVCARTLWGSDYNFISTVMDKALATTNTRLEELKIDIKDHTSFIFANKIHQGTNEYDVEIQATLGTANSPPLHLRGQERMQCQGTACYFTLTKSALIKCPPYSRIIK